MDNRFADLGARIIERCASPNDPCTPMTSCTRRTCCAGADGRFKYDDRADLWREKRREDRARRAGQPSTRWVWDDALRGAPLSTILRTAGIRRSRAPWRRWDPDRQPIRTDAGLRLTVHTAVRS